jgi:chloride channel protein, CIC family
MLDARSVARILVIAATGILVGAAASLAAIGFVETIIWANRLLLITPSARAEAMLSPALVTTATLAVPALGGLLVGWIVKGHVREQRPLGPADTVLAVQLRTPMPDRRSGLATTGAALVALCTGASVGQYGPLVFMGASIGALAGRLEERFKDIRAIAIACGVAAAISAAFHAPIAGLIFAHEVVLRHYALRAFAPVAVAAATGHVAATIVFGTDPLLAVTFERITHSYEYVFFALEGLLAAFLATAYMSLILFFGRLARHFPVPRSLQPALAGLALGLVALQFPEVLGIGRETLQDVTQQGAFGMAELVALVVCKTLVTALCLGFGFAGGVFSPALLIGGLGGALYGLGLASFLPTGTSGLVPYAICGMMAVASPVIGAPLTTILIVLELTGSYDLTIAVMTSVAFANLVAHRIFGRSLFDAQLRARGIDLSQGRDRAILATRWVRDYLSQDFVAMRPDQDVAAMLATCTAGHRSEVLLTDPDGSYRGRVRLREVLGEPDARKLLSFVGPGQLVFEETTTLWQAMAMLRSFVGEAVPLVSPDGRLAGVIPESAVIEGYFESTQDLRREENAGA